MAKLSAGVTRGSLQQHQGGQRRRGPRGAKSAECRASPKNSAMAKLSAAGSPGEPAQE